MASVYTDLGPGQVIETKTVRGRTEYRVAGNGFNVWLPEHKLGFADVDHDNSVDLPYNPEPQYGVGALSDSTIQPIHEIDPDKRLHPADSMSFEERADSEAGSEPGPAPHLFAAGLNYPTHGGMEADGSDAHDHWMSQNEGQAYEHESPYYQGGDGGYDDHDPLAGAMDAEGGGQDWHPSDQYGDLNQPYPADTWQGHDQRNQLAYRQADVLEGAPQRFTPNFIVNDTDDEFLHGEDVEEDERETTGPDGIVHFTGGRNHPMHRNAWAAAVPIAEAVLPSLARGVGMGAASSLLGPDGNPISSGDQGGQDPNGGPDGPPSGMDSAQDAADQFDENNPLPIPGLEGTGWGDLTQKHGYTHNLDDRYADIIAAYDPYDIVAQFRHDPEAVINRIGHAENEGHNPRMAQYSALVDADEMLRTAAWKDVRQKAVRLRREGRVHVKDVGDDRIYASVEGDHGTYEVMIKKGGSFGGFGGGHAVTNWRCACEWGKWAFQRRFTFIGRLCSHGLASYHEMQSQHLKGVARGRKRVNPRNASQHEAWAAAIPAVARGVGSLLGGEMLGGDSEDQGNEEQGGGMMDAVGAMVPGVGMAQQLMGNRYASDQTQDDWTIDQHVPKTELNKLRNWAEQPNSTWDGHHQEHNEDVREAVEDAREQGVDTDQLVASLQLHAMGAFRTAKDEGDSGLEDSIEAIGNGVTNLGNGIANPFRSLGEYGDQFLTGDPYNAPNDDPMGARTDIGNNDGPDGKADPGSPKGKENAAAAANTEADNQDDSSYVPGSAANGADPSFKTPASGGGGKDMNPSIPGNQNTPGSGPGGASGAAGPEGSPAAAGGAGANTAIPAGGTLDAIGGTPRPGGGGGGAGSPLNGDYTVQSGDTLSDIASRAGYGGNYQGLSDSLGLADANKINAGDKINVGDGKGAGASQGVSTSDGGRSSTMAEGKDLASGGADGVVQPGEDASSIPGGVPASEQGANVKGTPGGDTLGVTPPATPGGGAPGAPEPAPVADALDSPANTNPALNNPAAPPATPAATTTAITPDGGTGGTDTGAPKVDTAAAATPGGGGTGSSSTPNTDTGAGSPTGSGTGGGGSDPMGAAGNDALSGVADMVGKGMDMAKSFMPSASRQLMADRDWFEAAYPDEKWEPHKPFNGSGGYNITEWGQSKDNVKDNYSDNFQDVTDVPAASYLGDKGPLKELREGSRGITRAGHGPQRQAVEPVVVRERKPRNAAVVTEAHVPEYMDFDPLAPRTAASFGDPYSEVEAQSHAVMAAANGPRDIVAEFQQQGGGAVFAQAVSTGQYDDISASPAFKQAMQRTAGRNYSLAEQDALVREGDKGGAGNLNSLQLEGTHYEAMNSIGLW